MFPARIKRILSVLCLLAFSFWLLPHPANADQLMNTNPDVPRNIHTNTQTILIETMAAILCQLTGYDITSPKQPCLTVDNITHKIGFAKTPDQTSSYKPIGGLVGTMAGLISSTYAVPVHTGDYTSYLASNFGVTKSAYAQKNNEPGFTALKPMMNLWTKVRDLVYLMFVIMFVIIGIAIMLRVKLDPRTTMSIQNQIPKIIIYLLMITLSYAFAGLLIDGMWVVTYTGINILTSEPLCKLPDGSNPRLTQVATNNLYNDPIGYVSALLGVKGCALNGGSATVLGIGDLSWNVGTALGQLLTQVIYSVFGLNDYPSDCSWVPTTYVQCVQAGFFNVLKFLIGIFGALLVLIAILVQLFRLWFSLLRAYIYLVIYVILAPLWIFLGLIPGAGYGLRDWFNHMFFALSVYPITAFLFVGAVVIANDPSVSNPIYTPGTSTNLPGSVPAYSFVPPLIANPSIGNNMGFIVALAAILISPEVVNMMRSLFKSPPSKYTGTIMQSLGSGMALAGRPVGGVWGSLWKTKQDGTPEGPLAYYSQRAQRAVVSRVSQGWANRRFSGLNRMESETPSTTGNPPAGGNNPGPHAPVVNPPAIPPGGTAAATTQPTTTPAGQQVTTNTQTGTTQTGNTT